MIFVARPTGLLEIIKFECNRAKAERIPNKLTKITESREADMEAYNELEVFANNKISTSGVKKMIDKQYI